MNGPPRIPEAGPTRWSGRFTGTAVLWGQRVFFLVVTVLSGWAIYELFLEEIDDGDRQPWVFVIIWVLTAYVLLPRINRLLTHIYVPDYFIGRTRTADGLLGDPVNLAVLGGVEDLRSAMLSVGWIEADALGLRSSWRIITASVLRRSYPSAPVSALFVFGEKQTLAFEQEVAGNPRQRHHVRFWSCPPGWKLPGGFDVDLVGAATFDRSVGVSRFTFQITHRIAADTDTERDWVVASLQGAGATAHHVRHFSTGYHSRNGGGDAIETDGDLPILHLGTPTRMD
ncbi:LssY C-terminal domain-containing protein [Arthrobacter sp. Br18]|uniref:LssY C-terminal domain-containing protein n=1 Tax=Arthrobacter sp. Br18 TaxID=1312954 RepID=UPI0004B4EFD4|nr:LssY C-terminal domain-containing protein [Arthrobacter sp. Br18]